MERRWVVGWIGRVVKAEWVGGWVVGFVCVCVFVCVWLRWAGGCCILGVGWVFSEELIGSGCWLQVSYYFI